MGHTEKINYENYQSAPGNHLLKDMALILKNKNGKSIK